MIVQKNNIVASKSGRSFLLDSYLPENADSCPLVIFVHGIRGFKDWGCWHLMAEEFVKAGYAFIAFNFSHNGTTLDQPTDFADLEAYSQNNYSKELQDIDAVINWVQNKDNWPMPNAIDNNRLALIGHSRGGGISIIKASIDERIKVLITWAAVERLDYSWHQDEEKIELWKKAGTLSTLNSRTKQLMPQDFQFYEDFVAHEKEYSTEIALQKRSDLKMLIVHGTGDSAVPYSAAEQLNKWKADAALVLMMGADHVFGGKHPWTDGEGLGEDGKMLCNNSIAFLKSTCKAFERDGFFRKGKVPVA